MRKLLLFLLLIPGFVAGQDSKEKAIVLSVMPFHFQNTEQIISPYRNTGPGVAIKAGVQDTHSENKQQELYLQLGYAKPASRFEPASYSLWLQLHVGYEYLQQVKNTGPWKMYAGVLAEADYRLAHYPNWDDSHAYWATFIGGGLSLRAEKQFTNNKLFYSILQWPLAGFISRPPSYRAYKIDDPSPGNLVKLVHQQLTFASLHRYLNPTVEAGLTFSSTAHFSTSFFYQFHYLHTSTAESKSYKELSQGVGIRCIF